MDAASPALRRMITAASTFLDTAGRRLPDEQTVNEAEQVIDAIILDLLLSDTIRQMFAMAGRRRPVNSGLNGRFVLRSVFRSTREWTSV